MGDQYVVMAINLLPFLIVIERTEIIIARTTGGGCRFGGGRMVLRKYCCRLWYIKDFDTHPPPTAHRHQCTAISGLFRHECDRN